MKDELLKRRIQFTIGCVDSECAMVRRFALSVGRMNSILCRNAIFFSTWYGLDTCDLERRNIDVSCVCTFYESLVSVELRLKVHLIIEAIMIRERVMTSDGPRSCNDVRRSAIV